MRNVSFSYIFALMLMTTPVHAQVAGADCPSDQDLVDHIDDLRAIFKDALICGTGVGISTGDFWQEDHFSGSVLIERARGLNDPIDPTKEVGAWGFERYAVTATSKRSWRVWYRYLDHLGNLGTTYRFYVHGDGPPWTLCQELDVVGNAQVSITTVAPIPAPTMVNVCGF